MMDALVCRFFSFMLKVAVLLLALIATAYADSIGPITATLTPCGCRDKGYFICAKYNAAGDEAAFECVTTESDLVTYGCEQKTNTTVIYGACTTEERHCDAYNTEFAWNTACKCRADPACGVCGLVLNKDKENGIGLCVPANTETKADGVCLRFVEGECSPVEEFGKIIAIAGSILAVILFIIFWWCVRGRYWWRSTSHKRCCCSPDACCQTVWCLRECCHPYDAQSPPHYDSDTRKGRATRVAPCFPHNCCACCYGASVEEADAMAEKHPCGIGCAPACRWMPPCCVFCFPQCCVRTCCEDQVDGEKSFPMY